MSWLHLLTCAIIGYLLGNFQTGVIVGRLLARKDLRMHGSGSSGATNAMRVLGKKAGILTLLGDIAKGMLAVELGILILGRDGGLTAGLFVVIGHIWPAFFGFNGGKGIATTLGVLLILQPLYAANIFVVTVILICATRIVSLSDLIGTGIYLLLNTITAVMIQDWILLCFGLLLAFLIIFAHRGNIQRLNRGTEAKFNFPTFGERTTALVLKFLRFHWIR